MRTKWFNLLVLLSLVLGLMPVTAAQAASETAPMAQPATQEKPDIEVEDALRAQLAADETTGYLIYFKDELDLSPAYKMDWIERGRFVANALNQAALRSQASVRTYLDAQGIEYKAFWIDNVISVEASNRATFDGLMKYAEIKAIRQHRQLNLIEPQQTTAPSAPQAVEPNILHVLADQVWAMGYTGEGLVVANVDTGVRYSHDALVNQYRGNLGGSFDHNYNWWDPYGDHPTEPGDDNGHGTHTMGTMVGDDGGANQIGMAPGAQWMACRACNTNQCSDTALLECAEFFAAPWDLTQANANPDKRPNVINNSWGDCGRSYDGWYQAVVDAWHAAGIYPVFSNGNASNCSYPTPPGLNTVGNPARYGNVTGVGSTGRDNGQYAPHSNWGPTDNPDPVNPKPGWEDLKPQVLAPGVNIRSSTPGSDSEYQGGWGGTSMSAPHVTGLIALMWNAAPCLIGDYATTETIIEDTATPIPYDDGTGGGAHVPNYATGWGEINALAAVEAAAASCGDSAIVGQVTDSATSAPVAGATVWAASGADQRKTASDADGFYALNVFSDTYTLTASRYGYQTTVIPGVAATTGATTTQNIALTPAAMYEVSGKVTDAATGWPLYAHISVTGDPVGPVAPDNSVWTDPATGEYSLMLAEGVTYTFEVAAWVAGYSVGTGEVGPLTADAPGTDFALQADMGSCAAPGYYFTGGLMANFEDDTFPPAGWTVVNNGGTCEWAGDDPGGNGNLTGGTGKFAVADSDACGSGTTMNTDLISPPFDVSGLSQVNLSFAYDYYNLSSSEVAAVDVSADGGATWVNVVTWNSSHRGPATFSQDVTALLAGSTQAHVRFHYYAPGWDWWWQVDDVVLGNPVCNAPADGGLVVGNVYDENFPTVALNDAVVVNAAGGETTAVPTPLDAAVDDAFYTLFAPSGAQVFTATMTGGYGPDAATVMVVDGGTVAQDFQLPAGMLDATPDAVAVTVELGYTNDAALNLENTGGVETAFELKEADRGFMPLGVQGGYIETLPASKDVFAPEAFIHNGDIKPAAVSRTPYIYHGPMADAAIIVYADDDQHTPTVVESALQALGLTYTFYGYDTSGNNLSAFAAEVAAGGWDLVIYAADSWALIDASDYQAVADHVNNGGMAIAQSWAIGYDAAHQNHELWTHLGADYAGWITSPSELYWWNAGHPLFNGVPEFTDLTDVGYTAYGASMSLIGDPDTGLGGFTTSPADGEAGVIMREDGKTIYKGLTDNLNDGDVDGDSILDAAEWWTNAIDYVLNPGAGDVPWLSESPTVGTLAPSGSQNIVVSFDAAYVDQPGNYYAQVKVDAETPYDALVVPVTMTVTAPQSWGKLTGTITGLGVCDGDPAPLEEAEVWVESAPTGMTWMVTTDVNGMYTLWIDQAHSPVTVTVTAPDYFGEAGGVVVQQGQTTVVDFDLRLMLPCLTYDPAAFDVTLPMGDNTVELLTLSNIGAADAAFELLEKPGGFIPVARMQVSAQLIASRERLAGYDVDATTTDGILSSGGTSPVGILAAGDVLAQWPTSMVLPWGAGFSLDDEMVWVNDNAAGGGSGLNEEFDVAGNRTGASFTPNFGGSWPGDMAYNPNTGMFWQVNVGGDNCIHEWDPSIPAATGNSICGAAWTATSQRGLAYDPTTDTFFIGGWNEYIVYHIDSAGSVIEQWNLGISISGLAYNFEAGYLFIIENTPTDTITVFDVASGSIVDTFTVAGFGNYAAAGLAIDCDGNLWAPNMTTFNAYLIDSGVPADLCAGGGPGGGIPWLTEDPISGTIPMDTDALVDLTFDAGVPETMQPGTYYGELKVDSNAANDVPNVPVTLTVTAPDTWGKVAGVVTGLGYCDVATPTLLEEAEVTIASGTGLVEWMLLTDENGAYQLWLDAAHSPVDITIVYPDHITQVFTDVVVTAGGTTTVDAALRWAMPCLAVDPDMFDVSVTLGMSTTVPFTLTNWGAADAGFDLTEANGGVNPLLPQLLAPTAAATGGTAVSLLQFGESKVTLEGSAVLPHFSEEDILLDQAPNADNGIFSDAGCDLCTTGVQVVAENFSLDAEETIGHIVLWSGYYSTDTPIDPDHLTVIFHADASGSPGAALSTQTDVPYERVQTGVVLFGVHEWMHTLTLVNPVTLGPGTYWVEIYNNTGYGTDDFFWETGNADTVGNGLTGSAWATQAPGGSWNIDTATEMAIQLVRATGGASGGGIPWLSENPVSGAVDADDTFVVDLTFDASDAVTQVTQPGEYFGTLFVNSDDPVNDEIPVPVTMTVLPPATWGKLMGTVTGRGYCDADPAPLASADVLVESWMTETVMLTSTVNLLDEAFEGTFPPAGWYVTDTIGTGNVWDRNDAFGGINRTNGSGYSAAADSDAVCSGLAWDTELWSPPIDLTGISAPALGYESNFQDYSYAGDAWLDISTDGGSSWTNLTYWTDDHGPTFETVDLSAYVDQTIILRWRYSDNGDGCAWYWHIDDVLVTGETASLTDVPVSWALTTDVSGTYQVWLDAMYSPVTITVSYPDHEKGEAMVAVTGQNTTTQDFDLRWLVPCVTVAPDAVIETVELGMSTTVPMTISNDGAVDSAWSLYTASLPAWLSAIPTSGNVAADGGADAVTVTLDSGVLAQPGEYTTMLTSYSDDPLYPVVDTPVTFTVTSPAAWGQLTGEVSSTGHCDVNLAPLPGADVLIESWLTEVTTISVPLIEEGFEGTFPPASWTLTQTGAIDDPGWVQTTARVYNGSYSAYHDDASTTGNAIAWMIMPQVAIPAGGAELAFWQNQNYYTYYIYHGIWVSTASADPADFVEVSELGYGTEDTWEEVTLDLSAYAGQSIYIAFRYEGNWADEWYVDDVSVSYEMLDTVPMYTFNTTTDADGMYSYWMPAGSYTVTVTEADHVSDSATVTVPAAGAVAQDFSLQWIGPCVTSIAPSTMEVTVAMGMSTTLPLTMTNAGAGALNFIFSEMNGGFMPTLRMSRQQAVVASTLIWNEDKLKGECAVYVDSTLAEPAEAKACYDFVPESQVFNMPMSPSDIGYALEMYNTDTVVTFPLNNFTGQTVVGALSASYYGVDFDPTATTLYALNDNTDQLGTLDLTTGAFTALVPCAPGGGAANWTGLTIDPINGTFYGSTATGLYIIDPATGASTSVGAFGTTLMIDIAMNTVGQMYGHDIGTDAIYQIDPATGAATYIGLTGYAANYAQGMDFDNDDGTLYIFLYQGSGANVYGTVNLATGAVTPLAVSSPSGEFEGAIQIPGSVPIPWLFEDPVSGAVPAATTGTADITFDAGVPEVTQPGEYNGLLTVNNSDPVWDGYSLPVTMHVTLPATYGQITGTVMGLGPCADPATAEPLEGAEVTVQSATQTWTLFTDADGVYALWLDAAHSPVSIMANAADYVPSVSTGVVVTAGVTTVQDFALHPLAPCMSVTPADAHVTLAMGVSTTLPITVGNTGMAALDWKVKEAAAGFQIMAPSAGEDVLVVSYDDTAAAAMKTALTNLGYTYLDVENTTFQTMALADLLEYKAVFYAGSSSGDSWAQAMAYLDAGGSFYISDNDLGYYSNSTTFYQTYLQATYVSDSGADGVLTGVDIMAGVNPDVSPDPYPDDFIVGAEGVEIFVAPSANSAGVKVDRNGYKAIYTSFDFDDVANAADEQAIVERIMGFLATAGVPWLAEDPTDGTVALAAAAPVTLTFDASVPEVTQPGDYYATLTFEGGGVEVEMPVTMTVEAPATWGKLEGLVQGLGYCDVMTAPLEGAVVFVESTVTTDTWALETDAAGIYGIWLEEMYSPLTVTISNEAGYDAQVFTNVAIVSGTVTTLDANLLWLQPCMTVDPDALAFSVPMGTSTTVGLNLANMGAFTGSFELDEWSLGFEILGPLAAGGPDSFGYRFADSNNAGISPVYGFVDISDVGTSVVLGDNDFAEVDIGFDFKFYGDSDVDPNFYDTIFVNSNGFLSFGAGSTDISPDPLPDPTLPNNLIAAAWDDLKPGVDGMVYVESFGQCPYNPYPTTVDACFIVQYDNFVHADDSPAGTWEVILFHSGSILMQYADIDAPDATTGIEGPLGLSGLNYGPALADELAICFAYPGEWLDCQSGQVPWLATDVDEGDIAAYDDTTIAVTLDASVPEVAAPGDYLAELWVFSNDPFQSAYVIPVTMTVDMPAAMGKMWGTVYAWGYCDAVSTTMAGAQVMIEDGAGGAWMTYTDADGNYGVWLPADETVMMTVMADGYVAATMVDTVVSGVMPAHDVELHADMPCVLSDAAEYDVIVVQGESTTRTLMLHNAGAGALTYDNDYATGLWLSVASGSGIIAPYSSQEVPLLFDSTGLAVGVYNSSMEIIHNDPEAGRLFVRPIQMTVVADGTILLPMMDAKEGNPGETITYVMTVTNLADTPVTFDVLATGNVWTTTAPATVIVAANGTATFDVDVEIPLDAHTGYSDTVNIAVASQGADGQTGAAQLQTTVAEQPVVLALTKTADPADYVLPGGAITYTITLANDGNDPITIALIDAIPAGTAYVLESVTGGATLVDPPGTHIAWDGTLANGAQHTITFQVTANAGLTDGTLITNTVTATVDGMPYTAQATVQVGQPVPILLPVMDAKEGNPGETVTYAMTVTNLAAMTVTFDVLATGNVWTTTVPATVTVAANGTATFDVDVEIPIDAHTGDSDTVNIAVASQGADGQTGAAQLQTTVAEQPVVLTLTKTADPADSVLPGDTITYTITLANDGNDPITIALTDTIPAATTYISGSVTGDATFVDSPSAHIVWDGMLANSAQHTITFQVTANAGLTDGTLITNTVTATVDGMPYTAHATVQVGQPVQYNYIYLPLVLRNAQ